MNILQKTLYTVSNYPGGYKTLYNLIYENEGRSASKEQVLRNTLSRMKKKGLLTNKSGVWKITQEGKELLKENKSTTIKFYTNKNKQKNLPKTMIVVFDVPEKKRLYRDWLRNELVGFGFELVQKSVWFGPALPQEFITYLSEHKLLEYVRFFKVAKEDLI